MSLKQFLTKHVYNVVRTTTTKKVLLLQTSPLRRRNGASIFLWHYERNYREQNNCANYWHQVLYVSEGSNHVTTTWKKDFFPFFVCLFVLFCFVFLFFFLAIRISRFFPLTFFVICILFPSPSAIPRYPVPVLHTPLFNWKTFSNSCLHDWRAKSKTSWRHNNVYILSCKHASRPIRALVLS